MAWAYPGEPASALRASNTALSVRLGSLRCPDSFVLTYRTTMRMPRRTSARTFENRAFNSAAESAFMDRLWWPRCQVVKLKRSAGRG